MKKKLNNEYQFVHSFFSVVKVGGTDPRLSDSDTRRQCGYSSSISGLQNQLEQTNPYAPSAIVARITVTDSNQYIELVLSGEQGNRLQVIFFASDRHSGGMNVWEDWDSYTKSSNVNRHVRYVYTDNLLQAFEKAQSGKLISYT